MYLIISKPDPPIHYPKMKHVIDEWLALWVITRGAEDLHYKEQNH